MAAQKGKLFLLEMWDGVSAYTPLSTARSTDMTINDETVDVTNKTTTGFRALLEQGGIRSMSISIEGVFEDTADELTFQALIVSGSHEMFQISQENGDAFQATFQITSYALSGVYNGEQVFSASLESAGDITFVSA